jgi:hypothetical protein
MAKPFHILQTVFEDQMATLALLSFGFLFARFFLSDQIVCLTLLLTPASSEPHF